jgi:hypothetical protein
VRPLCMPPKDASPPLQLISAAVEGRFRPCANGVSTPVAGGFCCDSGGWYAAGPYRMMWNDNESAESGGSQSAEAVALSAGRDVVVRALVRGIPAELAQS